MTRTTWTGTQRPVATLCMALALAAGAVSCAPPVTVHVETQVTVVQGGERRPLPTGSDQARARAAAAAIQALLGHAVAVEVDAALTSGPDAVFVSETATSLEGLARILRATLADPLMGDFVKRKLLRIAARYRASAETIETTFEDATGTLAFDMRTPGWNSWLPEYAETIDWALKDAYARELSARFSNRDERHVAPEDHAAYFRYLTTRLAQHHAETEDRRAERLAALLRFEGQVRGSPLHRDVETYLAREASWLLYPQTQGPERATLRAAYARWVSARFFATTSETRRTLYASFFKDSLGTQGACPTDPCPLWPELARTDLALGFFDRPRADWDATDADAMCLFDEKDGKLERNSGCASVYGFLTENDARSDRLVEAIARTKRRDVLIAALANAQKQVGTFLGALARKGGPLLADALRILVNDDYWAFRDMSYVLRDQVKTLWPGRVDLRPILLRIVVEDSVRTGVRDDDYAALADAYAIDAMLFARFLDEGPRSIELSPTMWPALKRVATPFEIVAARLDGYLAARGLGASQTVTALLQRACEARDLEGLRVLRVVLQNRVKAGDQDALALALAAHDCVR